MILTKLLIVVSVFLDGVYGNYTLQKVNNFKMISSKNFRYLIEGILEGTVGE